MLASQSASRWAAFLLLAVAEGYFAFSHDPSRHELQAFLIARGSSGLVGLYHNLGHEGHPGLWHLLLLVADRLYDDPVVVRVLQAAIAIASLGLVWLASPFGWLEKLLLSLSYHLAFDYAIVAPGYGLGVVLFFAFVALRRSAWSWLALGLMANVGIHFLALGGIFGCLMLYRGPRSLPGIALCLVLAALAIVTAFPAPDTIVAVQPGGAAARALVALARLSGAFVPVNWTPPGGFAWSRVCTDCGALGPLALGVAALALGLASLRRTALLCAVYGAVAAALFLIGAALYSGYDRHYGLVFVALVGLHWMDREDNPRRPPSLVFRLWLIVAAAAGAWSIYAALPPAPSPGREAAAWLRDHGGADAVVAAYPGWMGIEAAAYLERPVYNLQAQRYESFVVWNYPADAEPSSDDLAAWLKAAPKGGALYLVCDAGAQDHRIDAAMIRRLDAEGVQLREAARFAGAGGSYAIFRVRFAGGTPAG